MIYFTTTTNEKLIDDYIWYDAYVEKYQPPPKTKLECNFYVLKASTIAVYGADVYDVVHTLAFAETKEELLVFAELHNLSMKKMHLDEQVH